MPAPRRDPPGDRAGGGAPGRGAVAGAGAAPPRRPVPAADRRDRTALRHRTLRTAIGWSHELCTPPQRLLWARLSVFSGTFDLEAAEYVCSGEGLPAEDVLDVLSALLAQSVLTREESPAGVRYRMLEPPIRTTAPTGWRRRGTRTGCVGGTGPGTWAWRPGASWSGFSPRRRRGRRAGGRRAAESSQRPENHCLDEPGGASLGQYLAGALFVPLGRLGRLSEGRHWLEQAVRLDAEPTAGGAVPAEGAVGAGLRGDPSGRHGARAGGAPGVPPGGGALGEPHRGGVRGAPRRLSGAGDRRHAARRSGCCAPRCTATGRSANSTATC
ncbi:hypothetical protein LSPH24S_07703 [Lysinibacillus sphaericus]